MTFSKVSLKTVPLPDIFLIVPLSCRVKDCMSCEPKPLFALSAEYPMPLSAI